eukprot:1391792-Pleurochrysis_carterae.AAC.2
MQELLRSAAAPAAVGSSEPASSKVVGVAKGELSVAVEKLKRARKSRKKEQLSSGDSSSCSSDECDASGAANARSSMERKGALADASLRNAKTAQYMQTKSTRVERACHSSSSSSSSTPASAQIRQLKLALLHLHTRAELELLCERDEIKKLRKK